jgi:hypothetical protein
VLLVLIIVILFEVEIEFVLNVHALGPQRLARSCVVDLFSVLLVDVLHELVLPVVLRVAL